MQVNNLLESDFLAKWWHLLDNGKIRCDLCPRECELADEQRGLCFVRKRVGNKLVLTTYGFSSGFCIDPIEKKPLHHFYPGSAVLSFGTAGCNLTCQFCQNWDISKSRDFHRLTSVAAPQDIVNAANINNCKSIAYTYNDPVIFAEYAIDTAICAREKGIKNVAVSAGYISAKPALEFFTQMDAANIDLKSFQEGFYYKLCTAKLSSVLETLQLIHHQTNCHLEITTLIIPDENDSDKEINELAKWIINNLSDEIPLHFSGFFPSWKMLDKNPTTINSLINARNIAIANGLKNVYIGNLHHDAGATTFCRNCQNPLIIRNGYELKYYHIKAHESSGFCCHCNEKIYGKFDNSLAEIGQFGNQRIPININN